VLLQPLLAQAASDSAAYAQIASEKNPQVKKKLALGFEKSYPKSKRLPEVYMELTKVLVGESDFTAAKQYAEKAVNTVQTMKTQRAPLENTETAWHQWLNTIDASAKKNLDWANQMAAWQQEQLRATLRGKR
jgi:hypothetical protein